MALLPTSPVASALPAPVSGQPRTPAAAQPRTRRARRARPVSSARVVDVRAHRFLVVSGSLPTTVAERRVRALADIGLAPVPLLVPLTLERARLYYGTFGSENDAQVLARRVRTAGYTAAVVDQ